MLILTGERKMGLDSNQLWDVNELKDATIEMAKNKTMSNGATKKLRLLLMDENVDADTFVRELKKIIHSSGQLNWDRISSKLQNQFNQIQGIPFFGILLLLFLVFLFRKTTFIKKIRTQVLPFLKEFGKRFIALLAYSVAFSSLIAKNFNFNEGVPNNGTLTNAFPMLTRLIPRFLVEGAELYRKAEGFLMIFYILFIVRCLINHFPKLRILRFHLLQGFLFYTFQDYPKELVYLIFAPTGKPFNIEFLTNLNLLVFLLNLYWLLPAVFQAITLSYPKNKFLRQALEINLGRDEEGPDGTPFKWWDKK